MNILLQASDSTKIREYPDSDICTIGQPRLAKLGHNIQIKMILINSCISESSELNNRKNSQMRQCDMISNQCYLWNKYKQNYVLWKQYWLMGWGD